MGATFAEDMWVLNKNFNRKNKPVKKTFSQY